MAKITWLGEDTELSPGPSFCIWFDKKFPKDIGVEIDDPEMIFRAKGNRYFKVADEAKKEDDVETTEEAKEEYNWRQAEKGSGYIPVKKKVRKKKAIQETIPDPTGEP